jgi:hypothetical protein
MEAFVISDPRPGDYVEVVGHRVGDAPRTGEIVEVLGEETHRHYRIRWEDGHLSLLFPGADVVVRRGAAGRAPSSVRG